MDLFQSQWEVISDGLQDGRESLQFPIVLGTGHPAIIHSISGMPRFFMQRGSEERLLQILSCLMLAEGLLDFYGIILPYITYPTEIPNFYTLNWIFMQLYHPTKEIPNFHTLDQFVEKLYCPTSPIQRKYPIFTPLFEFLSNYTIYPSKGNTQFSHP